MEIGYILKKAKADLNGSWKTFSLATAFYAVITFIVSLPSKISLIVNCLGDKIDSENLPYIITKLLEIDSYKFYSFFRSGLNFLVLMVLVFGFRLMALEIVQKHKIKVSDAFLGFKIYSKVIGLHLLEFAYLFPRFMLLIVPGIIKSYSYILSSYILADKPDIPVKTALKESEKLMQGHKLEYFKLQLRLAGWTILSLLTGNISSIFSAPYTYTADAEFYYALKTKEYGNAVSYGEDE